MFSFDDNLRLKALAWLLHYPFYIIGLVIRLFLSKNKNQWDYVQAPQHPKIIVVTGASQGLLSSQNERLTLSILS